MVPAILRSSLGATAVAITALLYSTTTIARAKPGTGIPIGKKARSFHHEGYRKRHTSADLIAALKKLPAEKEDAGAADSGAQ
jgi:hypothetical protein